MSNESFCWREFDVLCMVWRRETFRDWRYTRPVLSMCELFYFDWFDFCVVSYWDWSDLRFKPSNLDGVPSNSYPFLSKFNLHCMRNINLGSKFLSLGQFLRANYFTGRLLNCSLTYINVSHKSPIESIEDLIIC